MADLLRSLERHRFRQRYWKAPALWAEECIAWRPGQSLKPYQADSLELMIVHGRVAVRSLHGVGKTVTAALAVLWFATTREDLPDGSDFKIPTTAGSWRQLTRYLWPEIHKWSRRIRWDVLQRQPFTRDELLQLNLKLKGGEAFALASDDPALIEGAHADHVLFIYDESKSIIPETFDASEGAFMGGHTQEAYALAISTPGEPSGRFYAICSRKPGYEDWGTKHITLAEAIAAGQMTLEKVSQRERQWGRDNPIFQNRILGEFASGQETSVIPLSWLEAAVVRYQEAEERGELPTNIIAIGTDVGGDSANSAETVHALRADNAIVQLRPFQRQATTATVGQIVGMLGANLNAVSVIDVVGIGKGPFDSLLEAGVDVFPFSAGSRSDAKDLTGELGFVNLRSAAWWHLRELLDPKNQIDHPVMLPPDDMLLGDLTAPRWRTTTHGKIEVESKESLRKRLERDRSTDRGDAVVQAYAIDLLDMGPQPLTPQGEREPDWTSGGIPAEEVAGNFLDGQWP